MRGEAAKLGEALKASLVGSLSHARDSGEKPEEPEKDKLQIPRDLRPTSQLPTVGSRVHHESRSSSTLGTTIRAWLT